MASLRAWFENHTDKRSLNRELILCESDLENGTIEAIKTFSCSKGEGAVDKNSVKRQLQESGRLGKIRKI